MWDWNIIIGICAIVSTVCAIISATCAALTAVYIRKETVPQPNRISEAKDSLLRKVFSKKTIWKWTVGFMVSSLIAGGLWIYQQADPNGDPTQVAPTTYQNVPSTPSGNSEPVPAKASPETRRPTPIQIPESTPVPTATPTHTPTLGPMATPDPTLNPVPTHTPTLRPTARPHPTQRPTLTPVPTATPVPMPVSPAAPTLALSPTIRADGRVLLVVIDRYPRLAYPLDVQVLSTLVTGVDGLSVEIHNAVCNNTEHINTGEWVQLRCGYDEGTQEQTVIEYITAWHESVEYLRCEAYGIPNSLTMEFKCFTGNDAQEGAD